MRFFAITGRRLIAGVGLLAAVDGWCGQTGPEQLRAFLDGLQTLSADFEQTVVDASGEDAQQSSGSLAIRRPGRFRWDYRAPYPQQIVADGETIWIYDPDLEQVTRQDQARALEGSPAQVLSGTAPLGEGFEIRADDGARASDLTWVVLTPRDEDSQFEEVRLGFEGGVLARMQMVDKLGQTSLFRFSNLQRNPALDDASFRFEPPAGVDVLRR
ncbi:MAG: outer membrane lipoprotein chaperone LolA [Chromatiales bacterium]|jgi:outer membrane lipoprotein carrier protein